jgi:hypothetical protein
MEDAMDTIVWIILAVAVILAVSIGIVLYRKREEERREELRGQAQERREEARSVERRAEQERLAAEEHAERAEREAAAATAMQREADEVDPDVELEDDEVEEQAGGTAYRERR